MVSSQVGEGSWSISLTLYDPTSLKLGQISPISTTHHWAPGAPSRATMVAPPAHMTTKCPPMLPEKVPPSYSGFFGGFRSPLDVSGRGSDRPIMTIAVLTVTTKHGPWEGTNNGHPAMILTGMTHGHYQPALHPPPSDLGKFSPLVPTLPQPPPPP